MQLPNDPQEKQPGRNVREGKWKGKDVRYRTNRIIVKFKPISPDSEATIESVTEAVLRAIPKGAVLRLPRATGRALFSVDPSADIPSLAEELSKRDDLEYAEPDVVDSEA